MHARLKYFIFWLISAFSITVIALFVYVLVQHDLRQSANDPQVQMAEDAASQLTEGKDPIEFDSKSKVDISESLAYLLIYDNQGQPLASTGELNGRIPNFPPGVLSVAQKYGQNRITWQPESGVRSAIVVVPFGSPQKGFVVAGRSLREVEVREDNLFQMTVMAWLMGLLGSLIVLLIVLEIDARFWSWY